MSKRAIDNDDDDDDVKEEEYDENLEEAKKKKPKVESIYREDVDFSLEADERLRVLSSELKGFELSPESFDESELANDPHLLELPLLFPPGFPFQEGRLKWEGKERKDGVVPLLFRKSMNELLRKVTNEFNEQSRGLVVRGFEGAGKSYALYALVCYFRLHRDQYRVTYIPDCGSWADMPAPWEYWMRALVATFQDELVKDDKTICQMCEELDEKIAKCSEKHRAASYEVLVGDLMEALKWYTSSNRLRWILVVDQENQLHTAKARNGCIHLYPFCLVMYFGSPSISQLVIVGVSENNENTYHSYSKNYPSYEFGLEEPQYTPAQFKLVMDRAGVKEADRELVADVTNRVPYYVSEILARNLDIAAFENHFRAVFQSSHQNFYLDTVRCKNYEIPFLEGATKMLLHLPTSDAFGFRLRMDQQLTVIRRKEGIFGEGRDIRFFYVLEAIIPIAIPVIRARWPSLQCLTDIDGSVSPAFYYPYFTVPMKGKVVEMYIIEKLRSEIREQKEFTLRMSLASRQSLCFPLSRVVDFSGQDVLEDPSFEPSQCSLIAPSSQTYPHVDFFIWKPSKVGNELHAFQVVLGSLDEHWYRQEAFMARENEPTKRFLRRFNVDYKAYYHFVVRETEATEDNKRRASLVTVEALSEKRGSCFPSLSRLRFHSEAVT